MKTYIITKQRDGQDEKSFGEIYTSNWQKAIKEFKEKMLCDLYLQDDGTILDKVGNEVWGFNGNTCFSEDVYTYRLYNKQNSKKWII